MLYFLGAIVWMSSVAPWGAAAAAFSMEIGAVGLSVIVLVMYLVDRRAKKAESKVL